eukprot:g2637.t1
MFLNGKTVLTGCVLAVVAMFITSSRRIEGSSESGRTPKAPPGGHRNFIVVGGGVAGLQWGILLEGVDNTSYAILERNHRIGEFWDTFPRGRHLISVNKRYVGEDKSEEFALRHDWNSLLYAKHKMKEFSEEFYPNAGDLAKYMRNISAGQVSEIYTDRTVVETSYDGRVHTVRTASGEEWTCDHLIIATGYATKAVPSCISALEKKMENVRVYNYDTFPDVKTSNEDWCRNKKFLVLGSGNSAFETTNIVSNCASAVFLASLNEPKFSSVTHYVGNVRMRNADILDRYQLKSLDALLEIYETEEDRKAGKMCEIVSGMVETLNIDRIIFAGGFTTEKKGLVRVDQNPKAARAARKFPVVDAFWSDPDVPNRWYAGCLMHSLDYGNSAGGFIHGFRYLVRSQFRHIREQFFSEPWPAITYAPVRSTERLKSDFYERMGDKALDDEEKGALLNEIRSEDQRPLLVEKIVERIQNASGLYQMQDVLFDIVDFSNVEETGAVTYREEVPRKWIDDVLPNGDKACLLIGLQYSDKKIWDFELMFDSSRFHRKPGLFLHPVLIAVRDGEVVAEIHIEEDINFEFVDDRFVEEMRENLYELIHLFSNGASPADFEGLASVNAVEE